jgi:PLD-like domain
MPIARATNHLISVNAFPGDAKTLLAFDLVTESARHGLAGFTIEVHPPGQMPYYVDNTLRLAPSPDHARLGAESPYASVNAPIHQFRWVHVPGLVYQQGTPTFGTYTYVVTPRYLSERGALQRLDAAASVAVTVEVGPFATGAVKLGFTRGYVQSQAFARHFGTTIGIRPDGDELLYDTSAVAGTDRHGHSYTYAQEYEWLGFTARHRIMELLDEVRDDPTLTIDVLACELDEPDVCTALLHIGGAGRARVILDDAPDHHDFDEPTPEDRFGAVFAARAGVQAVKRGRFGRSAHDKVMVVSDAAGPRTVLTGSTNFSVTGLYVNANHVLVFDDRRIALTYAGLFDHAWRHGVKASDFAASRWGSEVFDFDRDAQGQPHVSITFSPHWRDVAQQTLCRVVDRARQESKAVAPPHGSVFFAVMDTEDAGENQIFDALNAVHAGYDVLTFGVADAPGSVAVYTAGSRSGPLPTAAPGQPLLAEPFSHVPRTVGHEVHHKFVVCGFRGPDPVVFCGSSNMTLGGEQSDGNDLRAIRDADVATAFVIEAVMLVDHYQFLGRLAQAADAAPAALARHPDKRTTAESAGWFLDNTDAWTEKYFDARDLHCAERELFGH